MSGLGPTARIVVVDRRSRRREQLVAYLQWLGYRAGGVAKGDDLLDVLDSARPDLVLLAQDTPPGMPQRLAAAGDSLRVTQVDVGEGPEQLAARIRTLLAS